MSVYVDQLRPTRRSRRWPFDEGCHLTADTHEELHAFAARIGMRRSWFQTGRFWHYDLNRRRREAAVALGAVQVTSRDLVRMRLTNRPAQMAENAKTEGQKG